MEMLVVLASLIVVVLVYLYVSTLDGSFINVLTPTYAIFLPAYYLVDLAFLLENRPPGSLYAYILSYGSYTTLFVSMAFGYSMSARRVRLPLTAQSVNGPPIVAWGVFAAAWMLYLPMLIEFRAHLSNPREIYDLSRTGYGLNFFLSTTLCYFAIVLLLCSRAGTVHRILFFTLALIFEYLHGSKHHMLMPFFMLSIWWVYSRGRRISMLGFATFSSAMCALGLAAFLVTSPGVLTLYGLDGVVGYSGYTRNGMLVIDSGIGPLFGSLSLEAELLSRIPRILYPDKPTIFGEVRLSEKFFPEEVHMGQGAPSMGFGRLFADYGAGVLPVLAFFGFLNGLLLRIFANNVRAGGSPGDLIMLLFGAGISMIPFADVILLPENLTLAVVANCLFALASRRSGNGGQFQTRTAT